MDIGPIYQEQEQWYQLCDFLKFIYCGVGEVGGLFNPQIFSNIWKILLF